MKTIYLALAILFVVLAGGESEDLATQLVWSGLAMLMAYACYQNYKSYERHDAEDSRQ